MSQASCPVPAWVLSLDSYTHPLRLVRLFSFSRRNQRSEKAWTSPRTHGHVPTKRQRLFLNPGLSGSYPLLLMVKLSQFSTVTMQGHAAHKGDTLWQLSVHPESCSSVCLAQVPLAPMVDLWLRDFLASFQPSQPPTAMP